MNNALPSAMQSDRKTVSVIIPTLGRESLKHCLDALERQTRRPDEVIVIHDIEKKGGAYGRNAGVAQASGELIAITDDDCVPPNDWLANMITIMEKYDADVVGGTMFETDPFLDAVRKRRSFPLSVQEDSSGVVGNTANIIYKRSILEECLRRDGHIFTKTGDDIELIWRIQQMGAKVMYSPNPVLHLRKVTPLSYLSRQFTRGITVATLYKANRKSKQKFVAQPSLLWGHGRNGQSAEWLKVLWFKVVGPFDVKSFQSLADFFVFWLGEKIQGIGFVWGLFLKTHP